MPASKGAATKGEVWLCPITKDVPVTIGRGENTGHTITYHNVVRRWIKLGDWNGTAHTFTLPVGLVSISRVSRRPAGLAGSSVDRVARADPEPAVVGRRGPHLGLAVRADPRRLRLSDHQGSERPHPGIPFQRRHEILVSRASPATAKVA